jgi:hypothetical protein
MKKVLLVVLGLMPMGAFAHTSVATHSHFAGAGALQILLFAWLICVLGVGINRLQAVARNLMPTR